MHMGYTSPRTLNIDDEGNPVQPYGFKENPHSIIDVADIVYINPVNVGLSRILDKDYDRANFFGVNSDIKYLAKWINDFVNKYKLWVSPKYLIGESYGTPRCSGLSLELPKFLFPIHKSFNDFSVFVIQYSFPRFIILPFTNILSSI